MAKINRLPPRRSLAVIAALVAGLGLGVTAAFAVSSGGPDEAAPTTLSPADCLSGEVSVGDVTYTDTSEAQEDLSAVDQAQRYVDLTDFRNEFPNVQVSTESASEYQQVVVLTDGEQIVGRLTYERVDGAWRISTISACSGKGQGK